MWTRSKDGESFGNLDNASVVQIEKQDGKICLMAYDTGSTVSTPIAEYDTMEEALQDADRLSEMLNAFQLGGKQ